MEFPIFKQEDYLQELGVGEGYTIAKYGCALCCITSLCNWYGRKITPDALNIELVHVGGFQSNGTTNEDGSINKTLLVWGMLAAVYGEIKLEQNIAYPTTPADMQMIDAYLAHNQPVIVGVSFLHNLKDKLPTHYVVIYKKNADGTYQCMDPWFGDSVVFDTRYAVYGMSVAQAILQVVAYSGPAPVSQPQSAPDASHSQAAVTSTDLLTQQVQQNWNLYIQEVEANKLKDDRIQVLEEQVKYLTDANTKLTNEIGDTKALNATLSTSITKLEASDSAAVTEGIKAQNKLKEQQAIVDSVSAQLKAKPTLKGILTELDSLFSKINWAKRVTEPQAAPLAAAHPQTPPQTFSVASLFGFSIKEVKS